MADAILEAVQRRDRRVVLASLAAVIVIAWLYLFDLVRAGGFGTVLSPVGRPWRAADFAATAAMWIAITAGMMLPSTVPVVSLFLRVDRQWHEGKGLSYRVALFVVGYLATWTLIALAAAALQWQLAERALLSMGSPAAGSYLGAALFVLAGLYEWTPIKRGCLRHCQSPLRFIMDQYGPGAFGAFRMGVAHGVVCIGCCWALVLLLFAGGVLNLLWVAVLAAVALVQKAWRHGALASRIGGAALIGFGSIVLARAL